MKMKTRPTTKIKARKGRITIFAQQTNKKKINENRTLKIYVHSFIKYFYYIFIKKVALPIKVLVV